LKLSLKNKKPFSFAEGFSLVEKSPYIPNQVNPFLCLSDTKNVNSITLFSQLQKDLIAIEDYHGYVKAVARVY
jgi:hypothetical protein